MSEVSIGGINYCYIALILFIPLFVSTSITQQRNVAAFDWGDSKGSSQHFNAKIAFGGSKLEPPSRPNSYWDDPKYRPYFDDKIVRNVTAQLGKTAYLHCKIMQLGDRTVSWVRQRDLHILTVGRYTYTSDQRFTCIHLEDSNDWTLEVKYVQKSDSGVYECQISTEPKMSYSVKLNVIAAKATIPEGPDVYATTGSTVNLTCLITESTSPPIFVFWYRDGTVINYDSPRRGIRVTTDKGPMAVSRLQISAVKPSDSGDYSCKPSYADFANVTIHVTNGEKSEAMHHGYQNASNLSTAVVSTTNSSICFVVSLSQAIHLLIFLLIV